jgi:uncharacterized membrane protein YccC
LRRLSDPGLASLRRAGRVAIVAPLTFAWYLEVVDAPTAALFGAFGSFAMLGFADFGGAPWPRTRAYLALTVLGAALALAGTALNPFPIPAALAALVVASAIRFTGCFGGYFQASVSPLVLAFVLGATVPETAGSGLGDRALGWVTAGVLAAVASLVLWPRRERLVLRAAVAVVTGVLADAVEAIGATGTIPATTAARINDAGAAMERSLAQPRRPAGPSAHDVVFVYVVDQVRRLATLVAETGPEPVPHGGPATELADAVRATLLAVTHALESGAVPPELGAGVVACIDRRDAAIARSTEQVVQGEDPARVVDAVDAAFALRHLAFLTASLGANVATLVGASLTVEDRSATPLEVPAGGLGGAARRLRTLVATHLVPTSTWMQDSVRSGCAVGVAVLIALSWDLEHGFWVVLGTLSVLRSNAFSTGRSAFDAAVGTAIGFALSAGILAVVGFDRTGLWVLVVACFFLAAYTPQVVGFVVGQACFTVLVVGLFNLIVPEGWRTGLVRLEDIAIGVTVSAVVGFVFWPRRAEHQLRIAAAALYRALAAQLGRAFRGDPESIAVRRAERRAHAAYESYVSEQLGAPRAQRPWATVLATASQGRGAIVALEHRDALATLTASEPVGDALGAGADAIGAAFADLATRIQAPVAAPAPVVDPVAIAASTRGPVLACITAHAHEGGVAGALDAAFARDVLVALAGLVAPARAAVAVADGRRR